ncbi:MAG: UpxY family transcription antiterminator [Acidobacteriia bacterium]|nr:UpxY family transcription antiterminator [Terriglobia bacterium]
MDEIIPSARTPGDGETMRGPAQNRSTDIADSESTWHALYTRHQHEKVIAHLLAHKGFEVFLPLYTSSRRWRDRTKTLSLPLIPCYVFFRGGLDRRLDLMSTPGVHSLVRSGDEIAVIPEAEIQAVRQIVESRVPAEPHPFLKCGDRVRVKAGPLEGVEGILLRKKDQFRLVLTVEALHRSISVELDATAVDPLNSPPVRAEQPMQISSPAYAL